MSRVCTAPAALAQRQHSSAAASAGRGRQAAVYAAAAARWAQPAGSRWRLAAAASGSGTATPAAALGSAAISVSGVDLTFTGRGISKKVLEAATLDVPRGSFHMLLGANGCGKSTLLRVLAGLFRPDAGEVHVDGPCAFVFQNPDHQVVMPTVAADVAFGLGRYQLTQAAVHAVVQHSLAQVGLSEFAERPTSSLSGGQKQRVAIAGALAECPRVLLLDELTTFLDFEDQENVLQCVRSIVDRSRQQQAQPQAQQAQQQAQQAAMATSSSSSAGSSSWSSSSVGSGNGEGVGSGAAAGVTALWVTHRLEELKYADSVSYMDGGRIAFSGTPQEMRRYMRRLGAVL